MTLSPHRTRGQKQYLPGQHTATKYVDGLLVSVHGHLVVKDQWWTPHGLSVVCDQRPALRWDVIHVEITLHTQFGITPRNHTEKTVLSRM